ncbi:MAG TPA: TAXI family TRAP transporter solute-binding subunit [Pseudonocardiaceae bacterium]|nr:TAXI family TRAP transporter solute-binding subunit [Pseudonocardiaceae bacterium]
MRVPALVLALLTAAAVLTGCQSSFAGLRLTVATGNIDGVYYQIGSQLAGIWADQLGIAKPKVLRTAGSPANIQQLHDGSADIGFSSADAIDTSEQGPRKLRALARIYDDYIQVVVRADLPIRDLADLAGRRVGVGVPNSQVQLVTNRILTAAGVHGITPVGLNLNDSISELHAGKIDAFFWSGGLPTPSIATLAGSVPLRLLDLGTDPSGVLHTMLAKYSVYGTALVPAATYGAGNASVTTLTVPNFLLVTDRMPNDVAEALVKALFDATGKLVGVNAAALGIDVHSAIYTQPVPLHPGAEQYYRSAKL